MGFIDLLTWLTDRSSADHEEENIGIEATTLAGDAVGGSVTPAVLANQTERSYRSIVTYLEEDEQPEYVLRGGVLLISDDEGSTGREHPSRETQVVVSDRRILFLVGGRIGDEVRAVPLEDVVEVYVDDIESLRRYFVVEADSETTPMTFYADVTIESDEDDLYDAVEFIERCDR